MRMVYGRMYSLVIQGRKVGCAKSIRVMELSDAQRAEAPRGPISVGDPRRCSELCGKLRLDYVEGDEELENEEEDPPPEPEEARGLMFDVWCNPSRLDLCENPSRLPRLPRYKETIEGMSCRFQASEPSELESEDSKLQSCFCFSRTFWNLLRREESSHTNAPDRCQATISTSYTIQHVH